MTPLGQLLHRKLNRCCWCGAIMEDCACTDSPGDEHLPMLPEFEQVPPAYQVDKREHMLDMQSAACGIGMCVFSYNALFSECGPLSKFWLPPLHPYSPDWWKKEVH